MDSALGEQLVASMESWMQELGKPLSKVAPTCAPPPRLQIKVRGMPHSTVMIAT